MASCISYKEQFIWVSNQRFAALIEFAIQIGEQTATTPDERAAVARLRKAGEAFYPGYDFHLDREFITLDERKFWARCFHDVARAIFLRQVGEHDTEFWQSGAIGDAYLIGRLLTQAVREVEQGWSPTTQDSLLAEEFYGRLTNIRL
jgi:hypothetical protein